MLESTLILRLLGLWGSESFAEKIPVGKQSINLAQSNRDFNEGQFYDHLVHPSVPWEYAGSDFLTIKLEKLKACPKFHGIYHLTC